MTLINISNSFSPVLSSNKKVLALDKTLCQSLQDFKDLLSDFEQLHIEYDSCKTQVIKLQERCGSNSCSSAEALKRIIESKDNIIQLVASTLTRLNETKDLKILDEVFKILFGETSAPVALYQDNKTSKDIKNKTSPISIKKEVHSSIEDLSFRDESVSEIEGTPTTGRVSPIIPTKKLKSSLITSTDFKDKKKCPDNWSNSYPEPKALKLSFSTPPGSKKSGKLRQARLNLVKVPESNIIDITSSPEFSGGCRSRDEHEGNVAPLIKKESLENDDTILPSPTSGPNNFNFKSKESPMKFKKPALSLKIKTEKKTPKKIDHSAKQTVIKQEQNSENILMPEGKMNHSGTFTQEDSINILNPKRLPKNFRNHSPMKAEQYNDETYCDTQSSISLLHQVDQLENIHQQGNECSPSKRPLAENINVTNMQDDDDDIQPSMSVLYRESNANTKAVENVKRKIPELAEIEYDEPGRKTKAERRLLPGWSCDECKEFFGELYKDDSEMLAKKINECSHHRGVNNPTEKSKAPPGFWNPRWNVPNDTEEFNRRNNVA